MSCQLPLEGGFVQLLCTEHQPCRLPKVDGLHLSLSRRCTALSKEEQWFNSVWLNLIRSKQGFSNSTWGSFISIALETKIYSAVTWGQLLALLSPGLPLGKRVIVFSHKKNLPWSFHVENLGLPGTRVGSVVIFSAVVGIPLRKMLHALLGPLAKRTNLTVTDRCLFLFMFTACSPCVAEKRQNELLFHQLFPQHCRLV